MRYALLLALLPTLAAAQDNDAEKIYRQAEKKIAEADAFRVVFVIGRIQQGDEDTLLKGSLAAAGDKFRLDMTATEDEQLSRLEYLVSDGKTIKAKFFVRSAEEWNTAERPAPKNAAQSLRKVVARVGLGDLELSFLLKLLAPDFDADKEFQASAFKLGAEAKIGKQTAKVITYKLTPKNKETAAANCAVWLDAETLVPLKHFLGVDPTRGITATYTTFDLKAKVDEKSFELPRK